MEDIKFELSLKNRLLLFLHEKEITDILIDLESSLSSSENLRSMYGNSKSLAKEIRKEEKINFLYIVEILCFFIIVVFTHLSLHSISIWLYSTIVALEYSILFLVVVKDYLIPSRIKLKIEEKVCFWFIEFFMLVLGIIYSLFAIIFPSYVSYMDSEGNISLTGSNVELFLYIMLVLSIFALCIFTFLYFVKMKFWFGGALIQAVLYIDISFMYFSRIGNISSKESVYKGEYIGNCGIAVFISVFFAISYYCYMTRKGNVLAC